MCFQAIDPRQRMDFQFRLANSSFRYWLQLAISLGAGLLAGGAQWAVAEIKAPTSRIPSLRESVLGWLATPALWSERNSQSPLRSPVNI